MRSLVTALAGALVTLLITACGSGSDQDADVPSEAAPTTGAAQAALTAGRWRIRVAVRPSRLGPIVFAARNLERAKPTNSDPWIQHDLVFRNTGNQPVTFADTRSSMFIGESGHKRLLVADEGCGYSRKHPRAPVRARACRAYLDLLTVKPHASAKRSITLFKGLPSMDRHVAGTYVFRRPVRFQPGSRQPGESGRTGVVRVVYEIASRPG
jgi:hypothetical protein